ncbi:cytosine permease [Leifsonia sp. EB34]|uniref:purine-cytosine permease family protein n=1 Tax=Leifsonia sp. EB34 TaxID=3156303 RepID=UPI0035127300
MTEQRPTTGSTLGLEVRSIDYVPHHERHGKVWHIGPLWFMSNAQIATLAVGVVSIAAGGNLIWSIIAIVLGLLVGTIFMAAHSSQGPQLGLPQMIQSRPQFGYIGALLVWLFAFLQYAGFNIFNTVLAGDSITGAIHVGHGADAFWFWLVTIVCAAVALFGYDLIHKMERYLTYVTVVVLALLTIAALVHLHLPAGSFDIAHFNALAFFSQFGVVAGYQISWAIYVSDYSRYLPADTPPKTTFRWTFWGSAIGGAWMILLGAYLAAAVKDFNASDPVAAIRDVADSLFPGFGIIALLVIAFGLMAVIILNMYGGSLTLISSIDSIRKVRPTLKVRVITVGITAAISGVLSLYASSDFAAVFADFLLLVLYFFIPWTAINLTDYFIVRKGHYAIGEIFKPHGIYKRWGWAGIVSYLVAFACMVPFFSIGTFFTGIVAQHMGGVDISLFIGLPVGGVLYWLFTRNLDLAAERALAEQQAADLENAAPEGEDLAGVIVD